MKRPELRDLSAFSIIAARRSFRRAALDLGVSVSSLSNRIRALEQTLGVGLLHRTTRSVALTDAGERLLASLAPALREVDDAVAALQGSGTVLTGRLRINAPPSAIDIALGELVCDFLGEHPQATVEVIAESSLIDIVAQGFDAGVRYDDDVAQDMIAVALSPAQRRVLVATPDLLERVATPTVPSDLSALPCLSVRFPSGLQMPWEFQRGRRKIKILPTGPLFTSHGPLLMRAALDGLGFLMTTEQAAAAALASGRLVRLLDDWMTNFPVPYLYYPSRRQPPAVLTAFVAFVKVRRAGVRTPASRSDSSQTHSPPSS